MRGGVEPDPDDLPLLFFFINWVEGVGSRLSSFELTSSRLVPTGAPSGLALDLEGLTGALLDCKAGANNAADPEELRRAKELAAAELEPGAVEILASVELAAVCEREGLCEGLCEGGRATVAFSGLASLASSSVSSDPPRWRREPAAFPLKDKAEEVEVARFGGDLRLGAGLSLGGAPA